MSLLLVLFRFTMHVILTIGRKRCKAIFSHSTLAGLLPLRYHIHSLNIGRPATTPLPYSLTQHWPACYHSVTIFTHLTLAGLLPFHYHIHSLNIGRCTTTPLPYSLTQHWPACYHSVTIFTHLTLACYQSVTTFTHSTLAGLLPLRYHNHSLNIGRPATTPLP